MDADGCQWMLMDADATNTSKTVLSLQQGPPGSRAPPGYPSPLHLLAAGACYSKAEQLRSSYRKGRPECEVTQGPRGVLWGWNER